MPAPLRVVGQFAKLPTGRSPVIRGGGRRSPSHSPTANAPRTPELWRFRRRARLTRALITARQSSARRPSRIYGLRPPGPNPRGQLLRPGFGVGPRFQRRGQPVESRPIAGPSIGPRQRAAGQTEMPRPVRAECDGLPVHERAGLDVVDIVEELAEAVVRAGQSSAHSHLEDQCRTVHRGPPAGAFLHAQELGRSPQRAFAKWLKLRSGASILFAMEPSGVARHASWKRAPREPSAAHRAHDGRRQGTEIKEFWDTEIVRHGRRR